MPKKQRKKGWKPLVGGLVWARIDGLDVKGTIQRISLGTATVKFSGSGWEYRAEMFTEELLEAA